jgi:hypothetical protein
MGLSITIDSSINGGIAFVKFKGLLTLQYVFELGRLLASRGMSIKLANFFCETVTCDITKYFGVQ